MIAARATAVGSLFLALVGCGGDPGARPATADSPASTPAAAAEGHLARCLPAVEPGEAEAEVLEPAPGVRNPAAVWGPGGGTVLVLLHQTDRDGLCGWTPFARHAVEQGLTAVALDMCGWAESECPEAWSERSSDQVRHAVAHAREALDADRVVLVGASMGAARTVFALADGVAPDAWVYLSGPPSWDGRVVADEARRVEVPGLVLHDPQDGDAEFAASRTTARRAGAEFVRARGGHGYDILWDPDGSLTRLGREVLDYARGSDRG
jgi:pimeloyl-ACP methyl ester carboxylesterase